MMSFSYIKIGSNKFDSDQDSNQYFIALVCSRLLADW
jgi:hypothetical protein